MAVGAPGYLAPEILDGDRAEPAADVFSWGAMVVACYVFPVVALALTVSVCGAVYAWDALAWAGRRVRRTRGGRVARASAGLLARAVLGVPCPAWWSLVTP